MSKAVINPEAIASLSDAIATLNNPTYEALTASSGFTGALRIIRCGKFRCVYGSLTPSSAGVGLLIYTLASSDRPPVTLYVPVSAYGISVQSEIEVTSDGKISINVPPNGNTNFLKFNFSYYVS